MKKTGIIRKIDDLGRIVIPKELRKTMGVASGSPMEFCISDNGNLIISKSPESCVICGSDIKLLQFNDSTICATCAKSISEQLGVVDGKVSKT